MPLEPLPESREALAELVSTEEPDLDESLVELGMLARQVVPDVVALSLTILEGGLTFTLVASNHAAAAIDATQYIDGGPCVEAVSAAEGAIDTTVADLLDEGRWSVFARASAAAGIASSLSMALVDEQGRVTGGINLYASTPDAFDGRHQELATALGTSAEQTVSNADLDFSTRERARAAPALLRDRAEIETAVGLLAARYDGSIEEAESRLSRAAEQAGVPLALVARVLILTHWQ